MILKMKKVFALLMIAGVFAMSSCAKKEPAAEAPTTGDSAAHAEAPAVTEAPAAGDSAAAASHDTTAAAAGHDAHAEGGHAEAGHEAPKH